MFGLIWSLIIGGIIGWIGGLIIGKDIPFGKVGNIIAGFLGARIGSWVFGDFGPDIGGFAIIPAILGAVIFAFILSLIFKGMKKT